MKRPYYTIEELVPHLSELREHLLGKPGSTRIEEYRGTLLRLEMLPYSLMACQTALYECVSAQEQLLGQISSRGLDDKTTLHLSPRECEELAHPVDTFLESARRCQNALAYYLSRALRVSVPTRGLELVVRRIERRGLDFGEVINDLLCGHWKEYGQRLKEYRDLSQHYAIVSSDARVFRSSGDGTVCLYLLLPTNPEVKNAGMLQYEKPSIHAYVYVRDYFGRLLALVYHVTRKLRERFPDNMNPDGSKTAILRPAVLRAPIVFGRETGIEGHRIFTHEDVREGVSNRIARNRELYDKHFRGE
jgi:hypothetical protein